ncbi:MAG: class I SAM-dependent rRNA methyltransferase [Candidatus Methylomirabilales bacterium]
MAKVVLRRFGERRVRAGHPWIYRSEIAGMADDPEPGGVVDVVDERKRFLGRGTFHPTSQIAIRLLTTIDEPIDSNFFTGRLQAALAYRESLAIPSNASRLVFSEADGLPGLLVDRYGDLVALQILTAGMERLRDLFLPVIQGLLQPSGVYLRNDAASRLLEGLPRSVGFFGAPRDPTVEITEGGVHFRVNVASGQKTGFFLDQRDNRCTVQDLARGRTVLDAFCYTGGFALHAARGGATLVEGIDISPEAVTAATENARLNGLGDQCQFRTANAFDELRALERTSRRFDLVILDPPAFTKGKETVATALRGYKEINLRALKLLRPGGTLVTSSCSYHVDEMTFLRMLQEAATDARVRCRVRAVRTQAPDHPVLLGIKETKYLKCVVLERCG